LRASRKGDSQGCGTPSGGRATYCKARVNHHIVSQAVFIATGVNAVGDPEIIGFAVGDNKTEAFWKEFLRSLHARGLTGVQLVIFDAHAGLVAAIAQVFIGSAWQRCRVRFVRDALAKIEKGSAEMVAATIRTIFAQPDAAGVHTQLHVVADTLTAQFPQVARMLTDAETDRPPTPPSPAPTGRRSGRPTPWNVSTAWSSAEPTSSRSSPTPPPWNA
jgi:putative transposase